MKNDGNLVILNGIKQTHKLETNNKNVNKVF